MRDDDMPDLSGCTPINQPMPEATRAQTDSADDSAIVATTQPAKRGHAAMVAIEQKRAEIEAICTAGVTYERLRATLGMAMLKSPDIAQCTPRSVLLAMMQAARWGLDPSGSHNSAWFIPRSVNVGNKQRPAYEMQLCCQPGYGGLISVVTRSKRVRNIEPVCVFDGDVFEVVRGTSPQIVHRFAPAKERRTNTPIAAYAIAWFSDGGCQFTVLNADDIARRRQATPAWKYHESAMWLKSAVHDLCKFLPIDGVAAEAVQASIELEPYGPGDVAVSRFDPSHMRVANTAAAKLPDDEIRRRVAERSEAGEVLDVPEDKP